MSPTTQTRPTKTLGERQPMEIEPERTRAPVLCGQCREPAGGADPACAGCGARYHAPCFAQLGSACPDCAPRAGSPGKGWLGARYQPGGVCYWGEGQRYTVLIRLAILLTAFPGLAYGFWRLFPDWAVWWGSGAGLGVLGFYLGFAVLLRFRWTTGSESRLADPVGYSIGQLELAMLPGQFVFDTLWDTVQLVRYAKHRDPSALE